MRAALVLEDGTVFEGESVGAEGFAFGEAVFTTAMTGYQEVVTDPSFAGQIVCFTAPMVGNYGVDETRNESRRAHAQAVVMREARGPEWTDWLHEHGVPALTGVDTRSLVLHLRERGAMRGGRRRRATPSVDEALAAVRAQPAMAGAALVAGVSTREPYTFAPRDGVRVAVVDYGCKRSILRRLSANGAAVDVFPHDVDADTLAGYDGVLLSNGPRRSGAAGGRGDDARASCSAACPVLGICLGHQLLALATGHGDVQAAVRPPRREPPGARPSHGRRARHRQNHGFAVAAGDESGVDAQLALRRHGRGARLPGAARALGAVPPGGGAGAARRVRRSSATGSRS